MDENSQKNHLKAYGLAYWILQNNLEVDWLLNYRGGSFLIKNINEISLECTYRGVSYEIISANEIENIFNNIASPSSNTDIIKLEKAPLTLVYLPLTKQPELCNELRKQKMT